MGGFRRGKMMMVLGLQFGIGLGLRLAFGSGVVVGVQAG